MDTQAFKVGAVTLTIRGDQVVISHVKAPALFVGIPMRALEAWALRKLRDDVLQPEVATPAEVKAA